MTLAEVMQCKEEDNNTESFSEVLRETINTSEEQHKHKVRKIGVIMLVINVKINMPKNSHINMYNLSC